MPELDQRRAADALSRLRALPPEDDLRSNYRAYADRLGPAIVMNGLGQALATECAAAGPASREKPDQRAHATLYQNVSGWLCREDGGIFPGAGDLLESLTNGDQEEYLRAQVEALAWLTWHKKFCHAELPRRAGSSDEDG